VVPTLKFTITPFRLWLERIDVYNDDIRGLMDWIERLNVILFRKFDAMFDE
jgi:hypothetical protein